MKYIGCQKSKTIGKHPYIGYWWVFQLIPQITLCRVCNFENDKARNSITIGWLCFHINIIFEQK